jgi:SAM-dependent methyltransferase
MEQSKQTYISFSDKWQQNKLLAFSETLREGSDIFNWIITRNGFSCSEDFSKYLSSKRHILDAGCGNGRVTALLHSHSSCEANLVGIDLTAAEVAAENLNNLDRVSVSQKDLLDDLSDLGTFDFIYCQEVLHHTTDPKQAFLNLCSRLDHGGEIAIYVYKKKGPIREFADDLIRDKISCLAYEEAIAEMSGLTDLGRALTDVNAKVYVPDIKVLGIPAGEYDVQRLLYHFFLKCFWNPNLKYEENVAINYDWYHPQLCTRHTPEEILGWFESAKLKVVHSHIDFYGITMRGINTEGE